PSGLTKRPLASKSKAPARVRPVVLPLRVTKNPSPEIIMSVARPVFWLEPWVKLVEMPATCTPRPTWAGLEPPRSASGPVAPWVIWDKVSWNCTDEDLKPVVFTLEMLLPVASSIVWWARRPEIPEYRERSMVLLS